MKQTKHTFVPKEFRLVPGTENSRNSVPTFRGREATQNSVGGTKNFFGILFHSISRRKRCSQFCLSRTGKFHFKSLSHNVSAENVKKRVGKDDF
jgi:hypothetical protein